jgi:acetylornithine deacetylase/succinyl-diaminopimelate desuccinylase-like protein
MSTNLVATPAIAELPELLKPLRERLLANLVMLAQIPAPTGAEGPRARFLLDRFAEAGLSDAAADEAGNAVGRLNGTHGRRTILLAAHLDTIFSTTQSHDVTVEAERITGVGVGDNALGAAIISMMPVVLNHLGIRLDSDLLLVGTTASVGRGNRAGIRFFLDHLPKRIDFGVCVEGIQLGRLNFFSIGTARADILCDARPPAGPPPSYGEESALVALNHIINRILGIALPSRPYTRILLGKMRAGVSYDLEPDHAELGLEVVSHSDEMIDQICDAIKDITLEIAARHTVDVTLDVFSTTRAGGIPFAHPMVKCVLDVMRQLRIEPDQSHSPSELSELIARNIPAVTLGITRGGSSRTKEPDFVLIEPILTGVAQLVGVALALDRGACDES